MLLWQQLIYRETSPLDYQFLVTVGGGGVLIADVGPDNGVSLVYSCGIQHVYLTLVVSSSLVCFTGVIEFVSRG